MSVFYPLFFMFGETVTQYVEIWDLYLMMYYDACGVAVLEILFVDEMLWYYSAASFEKLIMHVLN